jgi:hypothetical protein
MIIQAIVFLSFNLLLHYKTLPQCKSSGQVKLTSTFNVNVKYHFCLTLDSTFYPLPKKPTFETEPDDEDVARERQRVERKSAKSDSLLLSQLTKVSSTEERVPLRVCPFSAPVQSRTAAVVDETQLAFLPPFRTAVQSGDLRIRGGSTSFSGLAEECFFLLGGSNSLFSWLLSFLNSTR